MFFAITATIRGDAADTYGAARVAHEAYLRRCAARVLVAGSLVGHEGTSTGELYIIEAPSLLAAAQFVEADPLTASGAVTSIEIIEWRPPVS